jgi:hypothetical protein
MLLFIVGFGVVDQHIPFCVTGELPGDVTLPPALADVIVIPFIGLVTTIGVPMDVVNEYCTP